MLRANQFDPKEFLETARELLANGNERSYRSAISRAYYAAYWVARTYASLMEGDRYQSEGSHNAVWNRLYTEYNEQGDSIGEAGANLKRMRVNADYRELYGYDYRNQRPTPATRWDAEKAIRLAEEIIADIEQAQEE